MLRESSIDSAMVVATGARITDNIELVELLGEGGMASVWVAEHHGLRTRVAVKLLARELLESDPAMAARFVREASAAARIKSPHVVQILDQGELADGTPFIVMELLEGEDLHARLERMGRLGPRELSPIVQQVCKALAKAHALGIVHRDIKPDNIFIIDGDPDEAPFVKVLDFGVAKQIGVSTYSVVTATGAMVGTPGYMSPEQVLSGKNVDARTDLWSLAVVVYRALIGDIPFEGETLGALCVAISRAAFTPLCELRGDLPLALDAWMARGLARDRDERFQSARELAEAFALAVGVGPLEPAPDAAPTLVRSRVAGGGAMAEQAQANADTVIMAPEGSVGDEPAPRPVPRRGATQLGVGPQRPAARPGAAPEGDSPAAAAHVDDAVVAVDRGATRADSDEESAVGMPLPLRRSSARMWLVAAALVVFGMLSYALLWRPAAGTTAEPSRPSQSVRSPPDRHATRPSVEVQGRAAPPASGTAEPSSGATGAAEAPSSLPSARVGAHAPSSFPRPHTPAVSTAPATGSAPAKPVGSAAIGPRSRDKDRGF